MRHGVPGSRLHAAKTKTKTKHWRQLPGNNIGR